MRNALSTASPTSRLLTAEAIGVDPWDAVRLPIPIDASEEFLWLIIATAQELKRIAAISAIERAEEICPPGASWSDYTDETDFDAAMERIDSARWALHCLINGPDAPFWQCVPGGEGETGIHLGVLPSKRPSRLSHIPDVIRRDAAGCFRAPIVVRNSRITHQN